MSFITEVLGLAKTGDKVKTEGGKLICVEPEQTAVNATKHRTDDGKYLQFSSYWADIKPEIVDIDHINQDTYFCAMIKLGLLQKRGNSYLPPEEVYEKMKGANGKDVVGFYRKKSNSNGTSFGFNYETVGELNKQWKPKIVDLIQDVEDKLDDAWEEANEIAKMLKVKHKEDPTKKGKATTYKKRDALFNVSKAEINSELLGC